MDYNKALTANVTIRKLSQKAENGVLTAKELSRLCGEYGKVSGRCMYDQLLEEYPNGHVSEEDARRIISPILRQSHRYISEIAAAYQDQKYKNAGVGLKATFPEYNLSREDALVKEISQRSFEDGMARRSVF